MHIISVDKHYEYNGALHCNCSTVGNPKEKVGRLVTVKTYNDYCKLHDIDPEHVKYEDMNDTLSDIINAREKRTTLPAFNRNISIHRNQPGRA